MTRRVTFNKIPEKVKAGKRLGRHVHHDSRSKLFRVDTPAVIESRTWTRHLGALDQGEYGSCTGNAALGVLATDPYWSTLTNDQAPPIQFNENGAVDIYSLATALDEFVGNYPPDDTGSSGLGVAKACLQRNFITGYTHAFGVDDVIAGLQSGPGITGINWYSGMDTPDNNGFVKPTGSLRGGHEIECFEVNTEQEYFGFWQSWGDWGIGGKFFMRYADYDKLLSQDGDATFFTPLTSPPPVPHVTTNTFVLSDVVGTHMSNASKRAKVTEDAWLDHHLRKYFNLPDASF